MDGYWTLYPIDKSICHILSCDVVLTDERHVLNVLKIYSGTVKSDNVYKRHAAFGKRYELLMTSIAVMKKHKLKNH